MSSELNSVIHAVIAKAPAWIRHDLTSKDASTRERAEDALSAMIASAISATTPLPAADQDGGG